MWLWFSLFTWYLLEQGYIKPFPKKNGFTPVALCMVHVLVMGTWWQRHAGDSLLTQFTGVTVAMCLSVRGAREVLWNLSLILQDGGLPVCGCRLSPTSGNFPWPKPATGNGDEYDPLAFNILKTKSLSWKGRLVFPLSELLVKRELQYSFQMFMLHFQTRWSEV